MNLIKYAQQKTVFEISFFKIFLLSFLYYYLYSEYFPKKINKFYFVFQILDSIPKFFF